MFDLDHWQEIKAVLVANKTRTALTAFGVFWGIFLLIVMLGSGNGMRNAIVSGFGDGATNSFFLWTQRTGMPYMGLPSGRRVQLTNDDVQAIKDQVPEAAVVAPRNQLGGFRGGNNVTRGQKSGGFSVIGDSPEILVLQSLRLASGRFLNPLDLDERRKVAVIGKRVYELLFEPGEDPLGQSIEVRGVYFKVIGTFRASASAHNAEQDEQSIYVPFTTFQDAFNFGNKVGWLAVTSRPGVDASVVEEKVLNLLRLRHKVAPTDERAFGHFNLEEEYKKLQGLFGGISTLVWLVGVGTLAAGAIGVSNIMLIIVKERTKEIGVRRAIGAKPIAIVVQVLTEAVFLTAVAGYFGLVAGVGVLELVNRLLPKGADGPKMFANPGVDLGTALQALTILIVAGALAGMIPARRAISVSPMVALRSE
jgi:putative ABC transport system permease protein